MADDKKKHDDDKKHEKKHAHGEGPVTDVQRCLTIHIALGTSEPCECEPHIGGGRFCHKMNNTDSGKLS